MSFQLFPEQEKVPEGHSFAESRNLHPLDFKLRRHGFRIEQRRRGEEPIWSRQKPGEERVYFEQSAAVETINEELKAVER